MKNSQTYNSRPLTFCCNLLSPSRQCVICVSHFLYQHAIICHACVNDCEQTVVRWGLPPHPHTLRQIPPPPDQPPCSTLCRFQKSQFVNACSLSCNCFLGVTSKLYFHRQSWYLNGFRCLLGSYFDNSFASSLLFSRYAYPRLRKLCAALQDVAGTNIKNLKL